ncbi:MAG: Na+/H+ antiporter subunit E [Rhodospirillales bacterium]|nr:Na+/H+ antiporter subunit E [Rhodospirillales bacterium]
MVLHAVSLALVLAILWMLLSGFFVPLLLGLGIASIVVVILIARRMDVVDHEGQPLHLSWRIVFYWVWLIKEILVSAIHVSGVILKGKMPIQPAMLDIKATQRSEMGNVIFANSITLTPGTVTVDMQGDKLLIHALTKDTADGLMTGDMDRRVTAVEGVSLLDRLLGTQKAKEEGDT